MGFFSGNKEDKYSKAFNQGISLANEALSFTSDMKSPIKEIVVTLKPGLFEITTTIGTSRLLNSLINGVYEGLHISGYEIINVKYSTSQDDGAFGKNMLHYYSITVKKMVNNG